MWSAVSAVEVAHLVKSYDGRRVLDDVTFSVARGETVAVLGPNGAGKTTMIEILEGFRSRAAGEVSVLDEDPAEASRAFRTRVGVVLQESRHDPYLTVAETVNLVRGWYPDPLPASEVLELVALADVGDRRVSKLSGGQQRRLDLALGLVGRPELLFLDEPTTGFDPVARLNTWDALRRLSDYGTTVVLTTHYLDEAAALADRLLVLAGGRIVADGPPDTIGGRNRSHRVSFRPGSQGVEHLPAGGVLCDGVWRVTVNDVTATVHELSAWATRHDAGLDELVIAPPSLDEIYFGLIA